MTNKEILSIYNGVQKLRELLTPMPVDVVFAIVKNIRTIEPIAQSVEEARSVLLHKYAAPSMDEPGVFIPLENKVDILNTELEKLSVIENDIQLIKIPLEKIMHLQLTLEEMEALYPMISGEA